MLYGDGAWTIRGNKRLGIKPVRMSDGPSGLRKVPDDSLTLEGCEISIAYPCSALTACSFDVELIEEYGRILARECKQHGVDAILGPGINIKRNPLCGRNFEYYSEDPLVAGRLAAAFAKGTQAFGVAACLKHFACNSQESFRMVNDSVVDERALHEIYLRAFELAIKEANPWMVMAAYNKVNGEYACESKYLLQDILKKRWQYDGVVVSDWGGVNDKVLSHMNGLDVEMPCYVSRVGKFIAATRLHKNFSKAVEDSSDRIALLSKRTHDPHAEKGEFSLPEGHQFAVHLAEKSIVLAKNEGILPIKNLKKVAIIGEIADTPRLGGGGSSQVLGFKTRSFLDCCRDAFGAVNYAQGYSMQHVGDPMSMALDAVELASHSQSVIFFVGTSAKEESEGFDRTEMALPREQTELLKKVCEVNANVVVVVCTGAPVDMSFAEQAKGVFLSYFAGEGCGEALYRLVTGQANPCGHLAETWPLRYYEVPSFGFYPGGQVESLYRESIYVGYRFYLTTNEEVRYPFGHGLSYTRFRYSKPVLSTKKIAEGGSVDVTVTVTNATSTPGDALVQLYVEPENGNVFKAKRTIQGFRVVHLGPKESKEVTITLDSRAFEHYDVASHSFRIERGEYLIAVGENCRDIVSKASILVESEYTFASEVDRYPIYYQPPKDGFWQYDDAFEALLGHVLPLRRDPRTRPFTLNSTFENIKGTFIGRKVFAAAEERLSRDPHSMDMMLSMFSQMPIRNVILAGIKEKYAYAIVDLANGNWGLALFHALFGTR